MEDNIAINLQYNSTLIFSAYSRWNSGTLYRREKKTCGHLHSVARTSVFPTSFSL